MNDNVDHPIHSQDLLDKFAQFGMVPLDSPTQLENERTVGERRRRRLSAEQELISVFRLTDENGVLRWRLGYAPAPARLRASRRAAGTGASAAQYEVIAEFKIEDKPANLVGKKLRELDESLTPGAGLRPIRADGTFETTAVAPLEQGRILLIVHGTFSNTKHVLDEMRHSDAGKRFLGRALEKYDQVLGFNHPTLSVSPVLNAVYLGQLFRSSKAEVDVICHSRGGLVTRWWRERIDHGDRKGITVFVGSPLAGTGLAAPAQLKGALDSLSNLANYANSISKVGGIVFPLAMPLWQVSGLLFGFFGKLMSIAAKAPVVDAGVALIPGLAAQSLEGANAELIRAREDFTSLSESERSERVQSYRFVTSNFELDDPGWTFWRYFRKDQLAHLAADQIFEAANDLVVDTGSMTSLMGGVVNVPAGHIHAFGPADHVTHIGYFQQPRTMEFCAKELGVSGD